MSSKNSQKATKELLETFNEDSSDFQRLEAASNLTRNTLSSIRNNSPDSNSFFAILEKSSKTDESLLDSFYKLPDEAKVLLLHSALLKHKKEIIDKKYEHILAKDMVLLNLKTWILKWLFIFISSLVITLIGAFIYFIFTTDSKNTGIFSNFIKTLTDVLSVIFFNK